MKTILLIAGGRQGTLLLAPLYQELTTRGGYRPVPVIADTEGDCRQADGIVAFFGIGSDLQTVALPEGTVAQETAMAMTELETIIASHAPDLVMICGCDSASMAAAVTAAKLGIPVAAVDAGLRSYDRREYAEINRMIIDTVADFHFVSERSGEYNLINEGVSDGQLHFAGNLSIDSLVSLMQEVNRLTVTTDLGVEPKKYAMLLLNRSEQCIEKGYLDKLLHLLAEIAGQIVVLMPLTSGMETAMKRYELYEAFTAISGLRMFEPQSYTAQLRLLKDSALLITDADELQSEATVMNVPCLTMSESSSRPSTIEIGTNVLVGEDEEEILSRVHDIFSAEDHSPRRSKIPEKWDGASAARVVDVLDRVL
ncbi:MAG: UDP-N-acetylglucosamine 2-epimerase [Chlorobium sp.]|jgi:UDP-N-acetylglucosamine 2-epimerase (non-hydrolysing)|uniref:UDP-N-acetyl glucosamine 2-epimerase n=1 Tax=Chlorobium sp. TaxID=1095 RepID=UPI001DEF6A77|nr:UDP-N-acetylglucosamine 2-epimerase [Chlorobium sp.]MBN1278554.1 UDP-N-acetylglucosamine 2-epimerase [Chlorobiaceae bacterium]MCF8215540.1 UDP-N-acetylglucosamine 2-epimerase [Chlorobium sp.]MCF8270406.1 UDP-N-acetylglucosamine 2-epimerase [Chlorobium sp.]MCF8286776.1 UDP-N-acetylglucosamine 2-epimerase [Chlorobium sp.]MCF8290298.1 UDP-N-acetylglucosamine 2-epimerase [Chlorobium sp.]